MTTDMRAHAHNGPALDRFRPDSAPANATWANLGKRDLLGLAGIVLVNAALRLLELSQRSITPYFSLTADQLHAPWRLILPLDIGDGYSRWSPTGLVLIAALNREMPL